MTLKVGVVLAERYRADELLGRGGMGEVWRCRDLEQGRDVAVKAVRPELLREGLTARLFHTEVVAVARLCHPGIVPVYDLVRSPDGSALLVMEYRRGQSLASFVRMRPAWTFVRDVLVQILEALACAHARGVLHLDIKPENIVVDLDPGAPVGGGERATPDAATLPDLGRDATQQDLRRDGPSVRVTLVDFGIARVRRPGLGVERWGDPSCVVGTVEYMAPEQFTAAVERLGPWTDLYSAGVVAYELCAGKRPFPDADPVQAAVMRLGVKAPELVPRTKDVPQAFVELCNWLLEVQARDRPSCAADVLDTLREMRPVTALTVPGRQATQVGVSRAPEPREMLDTVVSESIDAPSSLPTTPRLLRATLFSNRLLEDLELLDGDARPAAGAYGLFGLRELPVLGRLEERRALWAGVRAALVERRPHLVLLEGPAGSGKSRLARDVLERAVELGVGQAMQTSWSEGGAGDEGLRGLVENLLDTRGAPEAQMRARLMFWLSRLPEAHDAFARDVELLLRPPADAAPDADLPLRVAVEAVALASEQRPVLLWLDDVQWSRGEAVALVRRIAGHSPPLPVCLIATAREEDDTDPALLTALVSASREGIDVSGATLPPPASGLVPTASRVTVAPLDRSATEQLVRGLLDVDDSLAALLASRAEGNPLFVTQMLRQLVSAEAVVRRDGRYRLVEGFDPTAIPADIRAVWERRVVQSGADTLALAALAMVRERVSLEVEGELARLFDDATMPASDATSPPADFGSSLAKALSSGLLRVEGSAYVWAHGLLREHLIQAVDSTWQRRLSALSAAALLPLVGREDVQEERARHLRRAGRAEDACDALIDAGVWSFRRADGPARKRRFELLATWAEEDNLPDRHARALAELAYQVAETGKGDEASALVLRAKSLLDASQGWGTRSAPWVAFRESQSARLAGRTAEGARATDQAIALSRTSAVVEVEILGLVQKGVDAARAGDADAGKSYLGDAISLAETVGERVGQAQALLTLAHIEKGDRAMTTVERSIGIAAAAGALRVELIAKQVEVHLLWQAGARDAAKKQARALAVEAARRSLRQTVAIVALQQAGWAVEEANLGAALEHRNEAARWGAAKGAVPERATLLALDVVLALGAGQEGSAEAHLAELAAVRGGFMDGSLRELLARARAFAPMGSPVVAVIDRILGV